MHTVELLEEAEQALESAGVAIREEWLGGAHGICELRGRLVVFLDPSQPAAERMELLLDALRRVAVGDTGLLSVGLRRLLERRQSA